jgi:hypothetical protein
MNEEQLRSFLKQQYPNSWNWHKRVDQMSYDQLVAVYIRIRGKEPEVDVSPEQLTLF